MTIRTLGCLAAAAALAAGSAFAQSPAPAPAAAAASPAAPASPAPKAPEEPRDDLPRGAPRDDYQFVGWCEGALATHIQLYARVKPELDAISLRWNTVAEDAKDYSDQQVSGRTSMALFQRAMRAAEAASTSNIIPLGQAAVQSGIDMWKDLGKVDARNQAYSWMNWELPDRCERVARDLENRSILMAPLLRNSSTVAVAPKAPSAPTPVIPQAAPTVPPPAR